MKKPENCMKVERVYGKELSVKDLLDKLIPIYLICCKSRGDSSV